MKGDLLDGTFLFKIDVFQKRLVFNVLIRGAHYGTPSRSPLAFASHFCIFLSIWGKFYFSTTVCYFCDACSRRAVSMLNLCGKLV